MGFLGSLRKDKDKGVSDISSQLQAGIAGDRTRRTFRTGKEIRQTRYPSVHQRLSTKKAMEGQRYHEGRMVTPTLLGREGSMWGQTAQAGGDGTRVGQAGWGAEKTTREAFFRKWSTVFEAWS